jgi:hypothetical protein
MPFTYKTFRHSLSFVGLYYNVFWWENNSKRPTTPIYISIICRSMCILNVFLCCFNTLYMSEEIFILFCYLLVHISLRVRLSSPSAGITSVLIMVFFFLVLLIISPKIPNC